MSDDDALAGMATCHITMSGDPSHPEIYLPECYRNDTGERCWTFIPTSDPRSVMDSWFDHVAGELGICRWCHGPATDDRPNREHCRPCWLAWHVKQGILPRDCPSFPGEEDDRS